MIGSRRHQTSYGAYGEKDCHHMENLVDFGDVPESRVENGDKLKAKERLYAWKYHARLFQNVSDDVLQLELFFLRRHRRYTCAVFLGKMKRDLEIKTKVVLKGFVFTPMTLAYITIILCSGNL